MSNKFLPTTKEEMNRRGWNELDIILITGDAYVDHPSYGAALIGRVLEDSGFKVGIIAQPDWRSADNFKILGKPRLFFGITSGNLDSMVANYTASLKKRKTDEYSPKNAPFTRPDRAVIVYANRAREAFPKTPVVIGGIEASLRRFAHYDYWSNSIKRSILLDSKADILVYGMGERQAVEIAQRLDAGESIDNLDNINGTAIARSSLEKYPKSVFLPSFEEVSMSKKLFNDACILTHQEADPYRGRTLLQKHQDRFVIQLPPAEPLSTSEMDKIYSMNFMRDYPERYKKAGGIPGFETVKFSVTAHRGCPGECSFCGLTLHQGRIVQSRSMDSILREVTIIAQRPDFKGTITDIGGPTANLYSADCRLWREKTGSCKNKKCIHPEKCQNMELAHNQMVELLNKARIIRNVKHVFIASGLRFDLLTEQDSEKYLETLCLNHISGQLKIAPEHISDSVLKLMNKSSLSKYNKFTKRYEEINKKLNKRQFLVNYFITSHPGSTLEDAFELSIYLKIKNIYPEQIQDFIPLPMTISGAMYYTESDPYTGEKLYVAKTAYERKLQRAVVQFRNPKNKLLLYEASKKLGKPQLFKELLR